MFDTTEYKPNQEISALTFIRRNGDTDEERRAREKERKTERARWRKRKTDKTDK